MATQDRNNRDGAPAIERGNVMTLYRQSRLTTRMRIEPLTTNTASIAQNSSMRPYKKFPTVNSADQMVMHPVNQPSSDIGKFQASRSASTCAGEIPAIARTCVQPGPGGRTFW